MQARGEWTVIAPAGLRFAIKSEQRSGLWLGAECAPGLSTVSLGSPMVER